MAQAGRGGRSPAGDDAMELLESFASVPRRDILDLVSRTPSSVPEIAQRVGLKPVSVRFHLQKMLRLKMIEEVKQRGGLGRPRCLYRATKRRFEVAYPPRNYMQLASLLLSVLVTNQDQDRVASDLRKTGKAMGSELGKDLKSKAGIEAWDGISLKKHLVEGLLEDFGTQPETVRCSKKSIQYRLNNCLFKELAVQYPQLVCEQLDDAVNTSLIKELGGQIDWRKLKCMGHGDSYCEYVATLRPPRQARTSPQGAR